MNKRIFDLIKEELVMLSLIQEVRIEESSTTRYIRVFLNNKTLFLVFNQDGFYSLHRGNRIFPTLKTKDFDLVIDQVKEWINKFLD